MIPRIRVAVLTVSDRCSRGQMQDTAGPGLVRMVVEHLPADVITSACVPDEREAIVEQLRFWAGDEWRLDLVLTTGGTGLGSRDVTPEATAAILDRRHPGLLELARLRCLASTPRAFLSRGEAGTIRQTLVVNLPGSQRGAVNFLEALLDILPHAIQMLRGEPGDHDSPPCIESNQISRQQEVR